MSNSTHLALGVALQALVEGEVPAIAEPQNLEDAAFGEVAADLLRHTDAHMLDDLFGAAHMRRDLGDRFDDQMQVADRDALGEQELENRLEARIGNVRGADFLQRACGIPGPGVRAAPSCPCRTGAAAGCCGSTSGRWVRSTDMLSTEVYCRASDPRRTSPAPTCAFMPKAGSRTLAGMSGSGRSPSMTRISPTRTSRAATTVPWILIGYLFGGWRRSSVIRISGTTKPYCVANFLRILPTRGELAVRAISPGRHRLAETDLYLGGLERSP